jgi:hypothetical protein
MTSFRYSPGGIDGGEVSGPLGWLLNCSLLLLPQVQVIDRDFWQPFDASPWIGDSVIDLLPDLFVRLPHHGIEGEGCPDLQAALQHHWRRHLDHRHIDGRGLGCLDVLHLVDGRLLFCQIAAYLLRVEQIGEVEASVIRHRQHPRYSIFLRFP